MALLLIDSYIKRPAPTGLCYHKYFTIDIPSKKKKPAKQLVEPFRGAQDLNNYL